MSTTRDQNEKSNPKDKADMKNKGPKPPFGTTPKAFQQFSNQGKFTSGPPKSFNAFHRRLNTRRSSGK